MPLEKYFDRVCFSCLKQSSEDLLKRVFLKISQIYPWNLIGKDSNSLEFCDIFKNSYFLEICEQLLLPSKHSSWWRRLEDVFRLRLQKTSWRRLDQDEYIRITHMSLEDVLIKINIFVLAIYLQDVFKTFSRHLQDILQKRPAKMFPRRFQDVAPG